MYDKPNYVPFQAIFKCHFLTRGEQLLWYDSSINTKYFFFQRLIALLVLHFYFYFSFHLIILNDIYRITVVMSVETFKTGIIVFIGNIMFLTSH